MIDLHAIKLGLAPAIAQLLATISYPYDADSSPSPALVAAAREARQFAIEALEGFREAKSDASDRFGGTLEHLCLVRARTLLQVAHASDDIESCARIKRAVRVCEGYERITPEKPVFDNYLETVPTPLLIKEGRPPVGFWR